MENPFRETLTYLDGGKNWIKGYKSTIESHQACLGNALEWSTNNVWSLDTYNPKALILANVIKENYPTHNELGRDPVGIIVSFNDDPGICWADIETVLEKAAVRWDERFPPVAEQGIRV